MATMTSTTTTRNIILIGTLMCSLTVARAAPQRGIAVPNAPNEVNAPFVAGFTPEVQQARENFQRAFNYLAELAHLAPDDPVDPQPQGTVLTESTGQDVQAQTERMASSGVTPVPSAPVALPSGYQFGGLTPEVAQATANFFRQYIAAANRANRVIAQVA
ncbi:hypothetical protein SK128_016584 [Halocaridina rubra]|uniref:Uncharacterized protein n=1 Tax=Halocaridina rubra TaxID=373956 RepID=A0AAN8X0B6_HALRR